MYKLIYKIIFLTALLTIFISCKSETKVTKHKTDKILPNGKHLKVEKTNKSTTEIGIFTKIKYHTSHQFSYKFTINRNDIVWEEKGTAEPKHLLFCKDSVYVHYLNEIHVPIEKKATDTTKTIYYKDIIKEFYEVYIDKRYFFKLLGEAYWIEITPEKYYNKTKDCKAYEIPNDKELQLKKAPIKDAPKEKINENS